jgi:hypothetical protein
MNWARHPGDCERLCDGCAKDALTRAEAAEQKLYELSNPGGGMIAASFLAWQREETARALARTTAAEQRADVSQAILAAVADERDALRARAESAEQRLAEERRLHAEACGEWQLALRRIETVERERDEARDHATLTRRRTQYELRATEVALIGSIESIRDDRARLAAELAESNAERDAAYGRLRTWQRWAADLHHEYGWCDELTLPDDIRARTRIGRAVDDGAASRRTVAKLRRAVLGLAARGLYYECKLLCSEGFFGDGDDAEVIADALMLRARDQSHDDKEETK